MHGKIYINFLSEWSVSSGIGDGHLADTMLIRDSFGVPYIPGRAVKGTLREGAHRLALCRKDLAEAENYIWGTRSTEETENKEGFLRVSSASLPDDITAFLRNTDADQRDLFVRDLCCIRQQTALNENRSAKKHSLRAMECGMPGLIFESDLEITCGISETWLLSYFNAVCAACKSIGGNRARGLGSCCMTLNTIDRQSYITLPPAFPLS